jgi:hypothetical protein
MDGFERGATSVYGTDRKRFGRREPYRFDPFGSSNDYDERARPERGESYDDPAVFDADLRKVTVLEDRHGNGEWRVEFFDDDGGRYVTVFAGPEAERRARAYFAGLKNGRLRTIRAPMVSRELGGYRANLPPSRTGRVGT